LDNRKLVAILLRKTVYFFMQIVFFLP
jgi:hypothetical protein